MLIIKLLLWIGSFSSGGYAIIDSNRFEVNTPRQTNLLRKELYKYGFKVKRGAQLEGVKRLLKINDYAKKYQMVKTLLEKLFKVFADARVKVEQSGYIPGEEFPEEEQYRESLGIVLENVALFGDLLLRLPDITHQLYDPKRDWQAAMTWGIAFCNETGVFEDASATMLNLVAQELGIIPRDDNYFNPHKEVNIKATAKKIHLEEKSKNDHLGRKKNFHSKKRGPRLGGGFGEL